MAHCRVLLCNIHKEQWLLKQSFLVIFNKDLVIF
jgi:hypothetical protein